MFIVFYSVSTFLLLNIFTGIMVDAIQSYEAERRLTKEMEKADQVLKATENNDVQNIPSEKVREVFSSNSTCVSDNEESPPGSPLPLYRTAPIKRSSSEDFRSGEYFLTSEESLQQKKREKADKSIQTGLILKEIHLLRDENKRLHAKLLAKVAALEYKMNNVE
jgi:hypothetical protein